MVKEYSSSKITTRGSPIKRCIEMNESTVYLCKGVAHLSYINK